MKAIKLLVVIIFSNSLNKKPNNEATIGENL